MILLSITLSGCAKTKLGKIDLSSESPPVFLKVGETTSNDVVAQIGEPFGYREQGNRSAMIYVNHHEDYYFLLITELRIELEQMSIPNYFNYSPGKAEQIDVP